MNAVRAQPQPRARTAKPPLRVVSGKGKRRRWSPVPVVVLVVLVVFGVAALQASLGQNGLKVAKLERELQEQTERSTLLRARVSQLSNPGRVADEADKLGLVEDPDPVHIRVPIDPEPRSRDDDSVADDPIAKLATENR
jgi:hypothetical protein